MALSMRVWRYLEQGVKARHQRKMWRDVELFREIPEMLQADLHHEVYQPTLITHPFFHQYNEVNEAAMRAICHEAVQEVSLVGEQDLFNTGQLASNVYFSVEGVLHYQKVQVDQVVDLVVVEAGAWLTEVAIWMRWFYKGTAVAKMFTVLIAMKVATLHEIMIKYVEILPQCCKYVEAFVEEAKLEPEFSDIGLDFDTVQFLAQTAFEEFEPDESTTTGVRSSNVRDSVSSVNSGASDNSKSSGPVSKLTHLAFMGSHPVHKLSGAHRQNSQISSGSARSQKRQAGSTSGDPQRGSARNSNPSIFSGIAGSRR